MKIPTLRWVASTMRNGYPVNMAARASGVFCGNRYWSASIEDTPSS